MTMGLAVDIVLVWLGFLLGMIASAIFAINRDDDMADEVDITQGCEDLITRSNMIESRQPEGPQATGECLWCDEPVGEHIRWCCAECRSDWETYKTARDRNGHRATF